VTGGEAPAPFRLTIFGGPPLPVSDRSSDVVPSFGFGF
jgi:hypothetical protein